jgi:UDP-2-acetamido-3-amino-2,3-dideoxy-glucuronate N-acetyltransferase
MDVVSVTPGIGNGRLLSAATVHSTAIIEDGVTLGPGTSVWDNVHIRHGASIGEECIIGEKTYIAYDVRIGNRVKLNSGVYVCAGVTIEDGVMISAHTVFTNDRFPRAATNDLRALRPSEPDGHTLETRVCAGATIGANATIGPGVLIGRYAMVGMGSVVTKSIPDHHLVIGNPARSVGMVCRCGELLVRSASFDENLVIGLRCAACADRYTVVGQDVSFSAKSS